MVMKLSLETDLSCSPEAAWREVKKPALLQHVARPLLTFRPVSATAFPYVWQRGESVKLRSYLLGFIPFGGVRTLYFEVVDDAALRLQTREQDAVIRRWDHLITVERNREGGATYTDSLELDAGALTLPVWVFAHVFYRHRQRRWRKLAPSLED